MDAGVLFDDYIERSCDFAGHRSVADSDCLKNEGVIKESHGSGIKRLILVRWDLNSAHKRDGGTSLIEFLGLELLLEFGSR